MNSLTLSVITINLDNRAGLARTLRSLEPYKGLPDVELIGIDGASADGSAELVREFYAGSRFVIERDSGIYDAMNKGLALSSGRFVIWLNSGDEFLEEGFLAALSILQTTDATMVTGAVRLITAAGADVTEVIHVPKRDDLPCRTFPHQSTFFDRALITGLGGYDLRYRILADRDLILRVCAQPGKVVITKHLVANYYGGGVSSTFQAGTEGLLLDMNYGLISRIGYLRAMRRRVGNRQAVHALSKLPISPIRRYAMRSELLECRNG